MPMYSYPSRETCGTNDAHEVTLRGGSPRTCRHYDNRNACPLSGCTHPHSGQCTAHTRPDCYIDPDVPITPPPTDEERAQAIEKARAIITKGGKTLLDYSVKRLDGKIELYVKSDLMWAFFKNSPNRGLQTINCALDPEGNHVKAYMPREIALRGYSFQTTDSILYDGQPQSWPLSVLGIEGGIKMKINGLHSAQKLRDVGSHLESVARTLYLSFIRPVDVTGKLIIKSSETVPVEPAEEE